MLKWRVGVTPKLTDAELVTLAVLQALLGFTSESRWLRHARAHLGYLFRYLPGSPATTSGCGVAGHDSDQDAGGGHDAVDR
jgi:hypothetical protein